MATLTDTSDMNENNFGEFVRDMRQIFEEVKELNTELDKMLDEMKEMDSIAIE